MPTAPLNQTSIFFVCHGQGPPCLVLHGGLGFDHTLYRHAFDRLGDRLQVVYLDQRGNGRSGRPPWTTMTMEQLADDAAGLLAHLGLPAAVVIGHSYGGFVAQELAIRHPDAVAGLVLVSTTPGQLGAGDDPEADQGPPLPAEVLELMSTPLETNADFERVARQLLPHYVRAIEPEAVAPLLADTIFSVDAMVRSTEVMSGWSAVDRLGQVSAPTLLIVGGQDVFCSPPQSMRIARQLPGAKVEVLADCGHFPFLEAPDRFFGTLEAWLDRVVGRAGEAPGLIPTGGGGRPPPPG
jgi:proline iminopeptidase